ncbi:MAG: hypothetical protein R3361_05360, partial [Aequorivita vladivostokensis]|nr:hypothetical protein [Aequorivita vladivostokensis]
MRAGKKKLQKKINKKVKVPVTRKTTRPTRKRKTLDSIGSTQNQPKRVLEYDQPLVGEDVLRGMRSRALSIGKQNPGGLTTQYQAAVQRAANVGRIQKTARISSAGKYPPPWRTQPGPPPQQQRSVADELAIWQTKQKMKNEHELQMVHQKTAQHRQEHKGNAADDVNKSAAERQADFEVSVHQAAVMSQKGFPKKKFMLAQMLNNPRARNLSPAQLKALNDYFDAPSGEPVSSETNRLVQSAHRVLQPSSNRSRTPEQDDEFGFNIRDNTTGLGVGVGSTNARGLHASVSTPLGNASANFKQAPDSGRGLVSPQNAQSIAFLANYAAGTTLSDVFLNPIWFGMVVPRLAKVLNEEAPGMLNTVKEGLSSIASFVTSRQRAKERKKQLEEEEKANQKWLKENAHLYDKNQQRFQQNIQDALKSDPPVQDPSKDSQRDKDPSESSVQQKKEKGLRAMDVVDDDESEIELINAMKTKEEIEKEKKALELQEQRWKELQKDEKNKLNEAGAKFGLSPQRWGKIAKEGLVAAAGLG